MTKTEKVNLTVTIIAAFGTVVGPIVLGAILWSIDAKITMRINEEDKAVAASYVSKPWFEASHAETKKAIADLDAKIEPMKTDIEVIKSQVQANVVHTTR